MSRVFQTGTVALLFREAGQMVTEKAFCEEALPNVLAGEGNSADAQHFALILLVGMVSQARACGRQADVVFDDSLNARDFQKVRDLADRVGAEQQKEAAEFDSIQISPEQILEAWQDEAHRIVKKFWLAIDATANMLEDDRRPSTEEIRQFINDIS